jgi:hypothetical protein
MKRLDFTKKEVEQVEPTLDGLELKIVGVVDDLEYYDWHQHESEYRKNERRIFTHPTEKIEVRIAIAIEGIDKVFLSTQVVQDIKWEKAGKYGKRYSIRLNGLIRPIIIDDVIDVRFRDDSKRHAKIINEFTKQLLALAYLEEVNVEDKYEVLDFLIRTFEVEEGLYYKEENYQL